MLLNIRDSIPSKDYERIAEIVSAYRAVAADISDITALNTPTLDGDIRELYCGETVEGVVVGIGALAHRADWPAERFYVGVVVDPAYTRRGFGRMLFDFIYERLQRMGGRELHCRVRDDDPASLHFAIQRGFEIDYQTFQSVLDLTTFDETPYLPSIEQITQRGLRFTSLAAGGCDASALHKLYHVTRAANLAIPDTNQSFMTFEEFEEMVCSEDFCEGAAQLVVEDESTGAYVGVAALTNHPSDNSMRHWLTGVLPEYQGQGIATALKVQAIRYARSKGAATLYTDNHSLNAPMVAINRKLGYRRLAGYLQMRAVYKD